MQENNQFSPTNDIDESLNLREQLENYLFHWKWFVLGVALALLGAYLYLRYTKPIHRFNHYFGGR